VPDHRRLPPEPFVFPRGSDRKMLDYLIDQGADVSARGRSNCTVHHLWLAVGTMSRLCRVRLDALAVHADTVPPLHGTARHPTLAVCLQAAAFTDGAYPGHSRRVKRSVLQWFVPMCDLDTVEHLG